MSHINNDKLFISPLFSLCRVKLLVNKISGEAVAMKMVDLKKHPDAEASVKKEVCIQKILSHLNILRFFGKRSQGTIEYIFLEYAAGGELFDRIGKNQFSVIYFHKKILSLYFNSYNSMNETKFNVLLSFHSPFLHFFSYILFLSKKTPYEHHTQNLILAWK